MPTFIRDCGKVFQILQQQHMNINTVDTHECKFSEQETTKADDNMDINMDIHL